ncbi:hypothetical protein ACFQHO_11230 [Actinomadura yumaensis]|uniref:hypothetical protein n=1 Tax=Actinomadura yumaensis TaxID=111807 RepID=UPI003610CD77
MAAPAVGERAEPSPVCCPAHERSLARLDRAIEHAEQIMNEQRILLDTLRRSRAAVSGACEQDGENARPPPPPARPSCGA